MDYYTSVIFIILLALLVLSILISENSRISQRRKRLFIAGNLLIALSAVAECVGVHLDGNMAFPRWLLAAVKALDYTLTPMTGGVFIALMKRPKDKNRLLPCLLLGNAIVQAVSAPFGWMVSIDNEHCYAHGPLYPLYTAFYCLIIVLLAVQMAAYGKSFRRQNRKSLYATISLVLIGIGIQEVLGNGRRVSYLALTLGAAFLYIHYCEFSQLKLDDKLTEQQKKIAIDPLTGVLSRFAYMDAVAALDSNMPEQLAVFLVDVNGLKNANDTIGHEAGDELICGTARCVENTLGQNGRTYRIGGDEFVVLADMTEAQAVTALAALKRETDSWSGERVSTLSVSAGYALAQAHPDATMESLVNEADRAMYAQKEAYYQRNGYNRRRNFHETCR